MATELGNLYSVRPGHTDLALPEELKRHVKTKVPPPPATGIEREAFEHGVIPAERCEHGESSCFESSQPLRRGRDADGGAVAGKNVGYIGYVY